MADTDIRNLLPIIPGRFEYQQPIRYETYVIDVMDEDYANLETIGTHNLITVPQNQALVCGYMAVEEDITSDGSATVKFTCGGDDISGAIPKANLVAGDTFAFNFGGTTTSVASYAKAADKSIDMVIATADLTAGKVVLVFGFIDINAILNNG